jgi:hypothetical protein
LDVFNNFIYQDLGTVGAVQPDTALDYERQPIAVRVNLDQPVGRTWRVESRGGVMLPSRVRAYVQTAPDSGFRQSEDYEFAGILVERRPLDRLTLGVFATYIEAITDRTPLPEGGTINDYRMTEREADAGVRVLARVTGRWALEGWLARNWRPQWQVYRSEAAPNVDYEDAAWDHQLALDYRPIGGLTGSVAWDADLRDVLRGAGEVPSAGGSLGEHNNEIRLEAGWRGRDRFLFSLGLGVDTDSGPARRGWLRGLEGRFMLFW